MAGNLGSLFDPNTVAAAQTYAAALPPQPAAPASLGSLYQPDPNAGMTHTPGPQPLQLSPQQEAMMRAAAAPVTDTIGGLYQAAAGLPQLGHQLANEAGSTTDPSGMISDTGSTAGANTLGAFNTASSFGAGGSVVPRPAGTVGMFGLLGEREPVMGAPQVSDAAGVSASARAPAQFPANGNLTTENRYLDAIPEPTPQLDRALQKTGGMSKEEVLASEPLWGYSASNADAQGVPHHVAFADLANQMFSAHGLNAYITPEIARSYMAGERTKYGMSPFGGAR